MADEGNMSDGLGKRRVVLGDLTNRAVKRRFSEREKSGIKRFDFNDEDVAKRIRVAPRLCTGINSLKGNVVLSISSITDENRDANVLPFGCSEISKSSIDVGTGCDDGYPLMGKNVLISNSEVHGGNKDITLLDLGEETAGSPNANKLDDDNDMVDGCGEIGLLDDASVPNTGKMAGQDYKGYNFTDIVGGRGLSSISPQTDCCSKLDLLDKEISGIAESACENKFASLDHTVSGNAFDLPINAGSEVALDSSEIPKGKGDLSLIELSRGNAFQSVNIEADKELCDSFPVDISRTVSESGGKCPHDGQDFYVDESKASAEVTQSDIGDYQNDWDHENADNLVSSQCGSIDCTVVQESQESIFGVEKSMELKKGDECALSEGSDSIKDCSCSFCMKAAYMWLDLNCQDIKARVSAMRKIQKEATILGERSMRSKVTKEDGAENVTGVSMLESDLMYQWSSLFQHMAAAWEEEGNQLEARLLPLTDLRQKCKADLVLFNAPPSEKH